MSLSANRYRESSLHTPLPAPPVRVKSNQRVQPRTVQNNAQSRASQVDTAYNANARGYAPEEVKYSLVSPRDAVPPRVLVVHTDERDQRTRPAKTTGRTSTAVTVQQRATPQRSVATHNAVADRVASQYTVQKRSHYDVSMGNIRAPLQSSTLVVTTPIGQFIIPNYELMNHIEIARERSSFETKFRQINEDWKHLGVSFELPTKNEPISNVAVRYQEIEKHLSTKTGSDFWFIILCVGWSIMQKAASYYGMPIDGYVESQIANYPMYKSQLIRMGAVSGFGTEWSPGMQVAVTSCASLVLMVILSKMCPGGTSHAPAIMREISCVITGNNTVETSSTGTPLPNAGGMMGMLTSAMSGAGGGEGGGIGGMISGVMSMFTGGGGKKKRSKKTKAKAIDQRRAPSAISFD